MKFTKLTAVSCLATTLISSPLSALLNLDATDILVGGNGLGTSFFSNLAINPGTGGFVFDFFNPVFTGSITGSGAYSAVGVSFGVDGAFIPDGVTTIDGASNTFDFGSTGNETFDYIQIIGNGTTASGPSGSVILDGVDYADPSNTVIGLSVNKGVTFDLAGLESAHGGVDLAHRFRATAGNAANGSSDASWYVFVDGILAASAIDVENSDGGIDIDVDLTGAQYLTLVSTGTYDGGGSSLGTGQIIFGNAEIQLGVVPEPSHYAASIAFLALGYVAYRRRKNK